jgi:hypothetical protein
MQSDTPLAQPLRLLPVGSVTVTTASLRPILFGGGL